MNKTLPVAIQLFTVWEEAERDLEGTLRELKAMGYDGVELAGMQGQTPEALRELLEKTGLAVPSAHIGSRELNENPEKAAETYIAVGCRYITISYIGRNNSPGQPGFAAALENIRKLCAYCGTRGVTVLYHNHDNEFMPMEDGRIALEHILDGVPDGGLQWQPDVCWVRVAGHDPVAYMRAHKGGIPMVHLKDYSLTGSADRYMMSSLTKEEQGAPDVGFKFLPLGEGHQDFSSVLEASVAVGAQWVVVEQDHSDDRPRIEAARMSREYLKSLGW